MWKPTITNEKMIETINQLRDTCYKASFDAGWHTNIETGELIDRNKAEKSYG